MFTREDLRKLIIPLILEQILLVTVGMADTMMVSSVGEAAVSGISLVDSVNNLFICLFTALATGGAVVSSQYLGQKKEEKACQSVEQLIEVAFVLSMVIAGLTIILNSWLIRTVFGNVDESVYQACRTYFYYSAISYPFLAVYNACAAAFRSMGNSLISLFISFVMNLINIVGNGIFIYMLHMGVAGAALATLISRVTAAVVMIILLKDARNPIHIRRLIGIRPSGAMIGRILSIGVPNGIENSIFQLGKLLLARLISSYGTSSIAANAVADKFGTFEVLPGNAIGLALITIVGQCIGACKIQEAKDYTKKLMKMATLIMLGISISIVVFMNPLLSLFHLEAGTEAMARKIVLYHSVMCVLVWPCSFTLPNALRAASDVKFTMVISNISMWTFRVICAYLLGNGLGLGVFGIWVAMTIDWTFRGTCFLIRFHGKRWLKKEFLRE